VYLVGFHYRNTVSRHIQTIQQIPNVQVILPSVYRLHFLLIKFIIYILLLKSIDMSATSHTWNAIHISHMSATSHTWNAIHICNKKKLQQ